MYHLSIKYNSFEKKYQRKYYFSLKKLFKKHNFKEVKLLPIYSLWKTYLLYPIYRVMLHRLLNKYIFTLLTSFRVDIKNFGTEANDVTVTATNAHISQPTWFTNADGIGHMVEGSKFCQKIFIKVIGNGQLNLAFKGADRRINDVRFPVWIDYRSIKIDGKELLTEPVMTWHDKPFYHDMSVKDGQEICVEFKQECHAYTSSELRDTLSKLYPDSMYLHKYIRKILKRF